MTLVYRMRCRARGWQVCLFYLSWECVHLVTPVSRLCITICLQMTEKGPGILILESQIHFITGTFTN